MYMRKHIKAYTISTLTILTAECSYTFDGCVHPIPGGSCYRPSWPGTEMHKCKTPGGGIVGMVGG